MKSNIVDGVVESVYTDSDIKIAHDEHVIEDEDASPKYSAALLRQYNRAKRASKKNDERSRKIVKQLTKERKKMNKTTNKPVTKRRQKTVFDFGGN